MKSKKFFYIMLGILAISIIAIAGAFYWGDKQLEAEASVVSDLQADRDVTYESILRLQKAKKDTQDIGTITELLDRLLPTTKEQDVLIADIIYTATAESGVPFSKVGSFAFNGDESPNELSGTIASKDYNGVYEYPFSMDLTGINYDQLLTLLQEIENNGRIIQIDNIQINPKEVDGGGIELDVSLNMKAYIRP